MASVAVYPCDLVASAAHIGQEFANTTVTPNNVRISAPTYGTTVARSQPPLTASSLPAASSVGHSDRDPPRHGGRRLKKGKISHAQGVTALPGSWSEQR